MSLTGNQAIEIAQVVTSDLPPHVKEAWMCERQYKDADIKAAMWAVWKTYLKTRPQ